MDNQQNKIITSIKSKKNCLLIFKNEKKETRKIKITNFNNILTIYWCNLKGQHAAQSCFEIEKKPNQRPKTEYHN